MLCKDNLPFKFVEGEGFKKLMKQIVPLYKIPCSSTIKNKIEEKYDVLAAKFQEKLDGTKHVTITTDVWTECMTMKSYLGITFHFAEKAKMIGGL